MDLKAVSNSFYPNNFYQFFYNLECRVRETIVSLGISDKKAIVLNESSFYSKHINGPEVKILQI